MRVRISYFEQLLGKRKYQTQWVFNYAILRFANFSRVKKFTKKGQKLQKFASLIAFRKIFLQKYSILDLWLGSKNTSNIQTFERKSQQRFVSCQNKLLTKSFFQRNLLALWYLYAFVKGYFFRLFLFHWISELTLQYHLYCNIKLFLCSCISYAHSK